MFHIFPSFQLCSQVFDSMYLPCVLSTCLHLYIVHINTMSRLDGICEIYQPYHPLYYIINQYISELYILLITSIHWSHSDICDVSCHHYHVLSTAGSFWQILQLLPRIVILIFPDHDIVDSYIHFSESHTCESANSGLPCKIHQPYCLLYQITK